MISNEAYREQERAALPEAKETALTPVRREAGWVSWWPVVVGVALGVAGAQVHRILAGLDPWAMRAVFPLALIMGLRETGLSEELRRNLPEIMVFLQFPLEGLLMRAMLRRGSRLTATLSQLAFLHGVCALVLWMVAETPR